MPLPENENAQLTPDGREPLGTWLYDLTIAVVMAAGVIAIIWAAIHGHPHR